MRLGLPLFGPAVLPEAASRFRVQAVKVACLLCVAALPPIRADAQSTGVSTSPSASSSQTAAVVVDSADLAKNSGSYVVTERGPNHRVWQRVTAQTNDSGEVTYQTNSYTELATGMHHLVNGQWIESSEAIQITADGGVANNCQHQVAFTANINTTGAIDLTMPDRNHLRSHILGLSYLDPTTGQYVLIASLKDSTGQVTGALNNQVVYADAFDGGFKADVVYRNTKAGIEQNILLREQLPSPAAFGLNPANTRLQVMTEFLSPPTAQVTRATTPDGVAIDQMLDFGQICIGQGQAFLLDNDSSSLPGGIPMNGFPVNKHWLLVKNRHILVEDVPFPMVVPQLQELPAPSTGSSTNKGADAGGLLHRVFAQLQLPPAPKLAKSSGGTMKYATLPSAERGFVLDYSAVNNGTSGLTFQSDTTYYVSGPVQLYGSTTIEGGAVIKYTNNSANPGSITVNGSLQYLTGPYRPAILTSQDDDSVGDRLPWSTGNPALAVYSTYLYWLNGGKASNLRFAYAWNGFVGNTADQEVWDCQFVKCSHPLTVMTTTSAMGLHNVLMTMDDSINNSSNPCLCPPGAITVLNTAVHFSGEQVTADLGSQNFIVYYIGSYTASNTTFALTNSIVIATNLNPVYRFGLSTNGILVGTTSVFYANTKPASLFQVVGGGGYYLAGNASFHGSDTTHIFGTPDISAPLLAELAQKTTWPPILVTNPISASTNFSQQATRDIIALRNGAPDLGYHYDPIDWLGPCIVTNATVTLLNGVVMGYFNDGGIHLQDGSQLWSQGTPSQKNYLVHYTSAQEQPVISSGPLSQAATISIACTNRLLSPNVFLRFTSVCAPTGGSNIWFSSDFNLINSLTVRDCEIFTSGDAWADDEFTNTPVVTFANNLVHRCKNFNFAGSGYNGIRDNLFIGCGLTFYNIGSVGWAITDNAFDSGFARLDSNITGHGGIIGNNAYLNGTGTSGVVNSFVGIQSSDIVTNLTWIPDALGYYYQPTTSPLIDKGSAQANLMGMYDYTTQTNQVKEANSIVDIGYHYVAVNSSGNPFDSNGNGIPDYLEDSYNGGQFTISLIAPLYGANYTEPATIPLQAMISGWSNIVTNVEFFSGSSRIASGTSTPSLSSWLSSWPAVGTGSYSLTAVGHDLSGLSITSAAVNISVTNLCSH